MSRLQSIERGRKAAHASCWLLTTVAAIAVGTAPTGLAAPALAQDEDGQTAVERITVTARYREESLQETPIAITAISGQALEAKNATNTIDIERWSPNVTIDHLGAGWGPTLAASIRGIGLGDFKAVFEPGVPIYIDDVVLVRPTGSVMDLLDLERVEVLRGPQGTLFGKNAAGGVIRLISRKPEGDGGGFVEGTIGDFNRLDVRASFDTTVAENLFGRFSFSAKRRDGHVDVLDFTCAMREAGTPELAGLGDGVGGWDPAANGGAGGFIQVPVGSPEDLAVSIKPETSPPGAGNGCRIDEMGDEDTQSARGMLRWVTNDRLEFLFTADVTIEDHRGPADKMLDINPDLPLVGLYNRNVAFPNYGVPFDRRFLTDDPFTIYSSFEDELEGVETPNVTQLNHWGVSGSADWEITDSVAAKLILAYREFESDFGRDSDGSPMGINHTYDKFIHEQYTAELRFNGVLFNGFTEWTAGGFYLSADDFNSNISILYPGVLVQGVVDRIDEQETENWALFVHAINHLTDRLSLAAGVRYTEDQKDIVQTRLLRPNQVLQFPVTPSSHASDRVSPMVSLTYAVSDDVNVYGTYAEGFRGGGFNARPSSPATVNSFEPEDIDSYEVGVKGDYFDNRLRLNLAAFFMVYENLQLPTVFVEPSGAVTFPPRNAGEAHIPGVEIELQAVPVDDLVIDASLGYLGFEFEDLGAADPAVIEAAGGNAASSPCLECRPPRAPEWTASLGVAYTLPFELNEGSLTVRGDASYQSRVDFAVNNLDRAAQDAYTLVDARLTWDSPDDTWSVSMFGTNLTDELYLESVLDFQDSLGGIQGGYGRPREFGVSVRRRF